MQAASIVTAKYGTGGVVDSAPRVRPPEASARPHPTVPVRFRSSLQFKAIAAVALLALYLLGIAVYAMHERAKQLHAVMAMERNHERHETLANVNYWLTHSVVTIQESLNSPGTSLLDQIVRDFHDIEPMVAKASLSRADLAREANRFLASGVALVARRDRDALIALRDAEQQLVAEIEARMKSTEMEGYELAQEYRARNQRISTQLAMTNGIGLLVFAAWVATFFRGLTRDIKRLETWTAAVLEGRRRDEALTVDRDDELGAVIRAVNHMQEELRIRDEKQEVLREQRFHQEKMAAIGSLAAAVAHEVNNPIDAISGIAQSTIAALDAAEALDPMALRRQAELVLRQSERIGGIVRQLSALSNPHDQLPELIDVNALVETNCAFIKYDPRFRAVAFEVHADRSVPPVHGVADHLTQVLMNLLINAADACEGLGDRQPAIRVATRDLGHGVELSICDNGHGMTADVLAQAFEEAFTTKPPDKGRGVGLFLCKVLIDRSGGCITLDSTPGTGTCARVTLPAAPTDAKD